MAITDFSGTLVNGRIPGTPTEPPATGELYHLPIWDDELDSFLLVDFDITPLPQRWAKSNSELLIYPGWQAISVPTTGDYIITYVGSTGGSWPITRWQLDDNNKTAIYQVTSTGYSLYDKIIGTATSTSVNYPDTGIAVYRNITLPIEVLNLFLMDYNGGFNPRITTLTTTPTDDWLPKATTSYDYRVYVAADFEYVWPDDPTPNFARGRVSYYGFNDLAEAQAFLNPIDSGIKIDIIISTPGPGIIGIILDPTTGGIIQVIVGTVTGGNEETGLVIEGESYTGGDIPDSIIDLIPDTITEDTLSTTKLMPKMWRSRTTTTQPGITQGHEPMYLSTGISMNEMKGQRMMDIFTRMPSTNPNTRD